MAVGCQSPFRNSYASSGKRAMNRSHQGTKEVEENKKEESSHNQDFGKGSE